VREAFVPGYYDGTEAFLFQAAEKAFPLRSSRSIDPPRGRAREQVRLGAPGVAGEKVGLFEQLVNPEVSHDTHDQNF